ncbi:glycoside hydrolase family 6 protein [Streptomyces sp. H39-S7]|uniref:glycoside hydrolase family 6 protein n=1 Tax=Streptomyces sp. H39-S7 TaxID=3004357 RepID=UPI0022AFF598|nr:glycoside hydrolase family 6 protein [Streptomyces sp. H39-S7]MCZ4119493.1 glycoside hydrolase family 6 protein [Streptomyces sp. H39-S7]
MNRTHVGALPHTRRWTTLLTATAAAAATVLCVLPTPAASAATTSGAEASDHSLPATTRFYTDLDSKAAHQAVADLKAHDVAGALSMAKLASWPVAQWFNGTSTPQQTTSDMAALQAKAARRHQVPVAVAYNVPGRDCSQYSAGGASNSAEYAAWIDALARGIGNRRTVVVLEPDGLALSPSFCGGTAAQQADRIAEISGAVQRLERQPGAVVYLDAGHSAWQNVGTMAQLLVDGGIGQAQGFFLNVSNYQTDADLVRYGTQVAQCTWYLRNVPGAAAGDCANQYWPPADADAWYASHVPAGAALPHFVIDSSRNGQGPWTPTAEYSDPQTWCNPPGRGLGTRPTAATGVPLLDAYLWIKVPGESDGSCTRGTAGPTDPEYGITDPAAGAWWPDQAHGLAARALPALTWNLGRP